MIQKNLIKFETEFKASKKDDDTLVIRGMASTMDIDRAGDVILPEAWKNGGLVNFKNNPIILFNHDYNTPIGKAIEVNVLDKGLEIVVEISKAAGSVWQLIKDGVLSTFSVGFGIKDADYIRETGGLLIKDAELYEVSVVTVPCNQAAVFSVSKSFNNDEEYAEFIKQFSGDLAGQSLAKRDAKVSNTASNTPEGAKSAHLEIEMTEEQIKAIEERAAARAKAEFEAAQKAAADKAAAEKAAAEAEAERVKSVVVTAMETGAEKLMAEMKAEMEKKNADLAEVINKYKAEMEAQKEEITKMRESKRHFAADGKEKDLSPWAKDFLSAKLLGVVTGKGYNTTFASQLAQKAGVDYTTSAGDIDQTVSTTIEKEIRLMLRLATAFREIPVISGATVLPLQTESEKATWQATGAPSGNLENRGDSDNTFKAKQVILNAYRLISSTYIDNDTDEQVLVNLMPMLIDAVAHAHARAVDDVIINGNTNIDGLADYAAASGLTLDISDGTKLTADILMGARAKMGKYGIQPRDVAYVVSMQGYYDLINDGDFQNIDEVGNDMATKVTGTVGGVFGSPVIVSDNMPAVANLAPAAFAVNVRNYVIPRLRGINLESDYEVGNQRRIVVASQSLGFEELFAGAGVNEPCVSVGYVS